MPKHGTKGVYIGRTTTTSEIFVSLSEIRKVVIFDLNNATFQLGKDSTKRQTVGIPMGSPLSAAIAPATCVCYEGIFYSKPRTQLLLKDIEPEGIRYMDDQIAIAAFNRSNTHARLHAIEFIKSLATCYDEKMIMENEATNIEFGISINPTGILTSSKL